MFFDRLLQNIQIDTSQEIIHNTIKKLYMA